MWKAVWLQLYDKVIKWLDKQTSKLLTIKLTIKGQMPEKQYVTSLTFIQFCDQVVDQSARKTPKMWTTV